MSAQCKRESAATGAEPVWQPVKLQKGGSVASVMTMQILGNQSKKDDDDNIRKQSPGDCGPSIL